MACVGTEPLGALSIFRLGIVAYAASAVLAAAPAEAAQPRPHFSLPAGLPLDRALTAFSAQSDRDILFAPGMVSGLRSRRVAGRMEADDALGELLRGSGLTWREFQGRFLIERETVAQPDPPPPETASE